MKWFLVIIFAFNIGLSSSQSVIVSGIVTSEFNKLPIEGVMIKQEHTLKTLAKTNAKGEYHLTVSDIENFSLLFDHVAFENKSIFISKKMLKKNQGDTIKVNINLGPNQLKSIEIRPPDIPDTVFGSERISVSDFTFYTENRMILLVFEKSLKKDSRLVLCDENQKILSEILINDKAIKLYKDYYDRVFVICEQSIVYITVFGNQLLQEWVKADFFYTYIYPVIDTLGQYIYYSNYSPDFPSFDYFAYNTFDSSHRKIARIEDQFMMELYTAEYKYVSGAEKLWAFRKELETGVDKEIWIGLKYFTNSIYYQPPYAPMFLSGEDLVIFDHYKDMVISYDTGFNPIDSFPISYHKVRGKKKWKNEVLKDDATDKFYTIFQKDGYYLVSEIDHTTGEISQSQKLFYKYTKKIKIYNGYIYYIYRPFESSQNQFLYKQKIIL